MQNAVLFTRRRRQWRIPVTEPGGPLRSHGPVPEAPVPRYRDPTMDEATELEVATLYERLDASRRES